MATKIDSILRIAKIYEFELDGVSRKEILDYGEREWGIGPRQMRNYILRAEKKIKQDAQVIEEKAFDRVRTRYERQYRRAVQDEDGHLVRCLLIDMRKMYGMDKPEQIALSGHVNTTKRIEFEFIVNESKKIEPGKRRMILQSLMKQLDIPKEQGDNGEIDAIYVDKQEESPMNKSNRVNK